MNNRLSLLCALTAFTVTAHAQQPVSTEWLPTPVLHEVHDAFKAASAVNILDARFIEYKAEGKDFFHFETIHQIIKVKDDAGIEQNNKVFIYKPRYGEIQDIKARTILPGGKVINLDASSIKETEKDGSIYKQFAVDGLEKNAEVEYSYVIKKNVQLFSSETFQDTYTPCQYAVFSLTTPAHLEFSTKGYNGFTINSDTVLGEKRVITGFATDLKELADEKYAYQRQYLARVDYKLSYNKNNSGVVRLYTWKEFAKKAYPMYTEVSSKEEKALNQFTSKIKIAADATPADKILAVEDYVKNTINIDKDLISEDADDINKIVLTNAANEKGASRLLAGIYARLNIPVNLVFVNKRSSYPLDEELENWDLANDVLLYFTQTGKFLQPGDISCRYPYVSPLLAGTRGLFLKETTIGTLKTAIGSFRQIGMEPFADSYFNLDAEVRLNETQDEALVKMKQMLGGYAAMDYRPVYRFLPPEKQKDINEALLKLQGNSNEISNVKVENTALTDGFYNKPLIISGDVKTVELLEKAGKKILLKVGEVIGMQTEMYQEKPRQLPVELSYAHTLSRKIKVYIPEGYTVKNADDLRFNIAFTSGTDTTMGFVSSYVTEGNTITVSITESYNELRYPLTDFDNFRKVINAAADFNKVVLVLEKK